MSCFCQVTQKEGAEKQLEMSTMAVFAIKEDEDPLRPRALFTLVSHHFFSK